jgi:molybdopterin-guanine dinucleotide biosynthesis protein A
MAWTALVLAGGESFRMKEEKAFLQFEGKSLVERTLDTLKPLFEKIIIIAKQPERFQSFSVPVLVDIFPGCGPMGGIYTGLLNAKGPVFAVAVDMPFLNPALIRILLDRSEGFEAALYRSSDGIHPLHAVYAQSALPVMEGLLKEKQLKMTHLLERIKTLEIDVEEIKSQDLSKRGLTNINTPEDYRKLLKDK